MTSWTNPSAAPRTTTRPSCDWLPLISMLPWHGLSFARVRWVDAPLGRFWRIVQQRGMSLKSGRECSDKVRGRHRFLWRGFGDAPAKSWGRLQYAGGRLAAAASRISVPVDNMRIFNGMAKLFEASLRHGYCGSSRITGEGRPG